MNPDTLKRTSATACAVVPEVSYFAHARESGSKAGL